MSGVTRQSGFRVGYRRHHDFPTRFPGEDQLGRRKCDDQFRSLGQSTLRPDYIAGCNKDIAEALFPESRSGSIPPALPRRVAWIRPVRRSTHGPSATSPGSMLRSVNRASTTLTSPCSRGPTSQKSGHRIPHGILQPVQSSPVWASERDADQCDVRTGDKYRQPSTSDSVRLEDCFLSYASEDLGRLTACPFFCV